MNSKSEAAKRQTIRVNSGFSFIIVLSRLRSQILKLVLVIFVKEFYYKLAVYQ